MLTGVCQPFNFTNVFYDVLQGCGKTSVLESFIGSGFLPKGLAPESGGGDVENKLKTTCPVVINLVKCELTKGCSKI